MNHKQIRKQLEQMNISEAVSEEVNIGQLSGGKSHPAILLQWNGVEEYFTGFDHTGDPEVIANKKLELMEVWADENLDRS